MKVPGAGSAPALQKPWPSDGFDALIAWAASSAAVITRGELVANGPGRGRDAAFARQRPDPHRQRDHHHRNVDQAICRQSDKGTDASRVAVEMANLLDELS